MRTSVGGDPAIELDLRLPAGATAPAYARAIVAGLGDRVADDLLDDLVLLVSEIVTNSVRHAALAPDESIRLRVRGTGRSIRLDIVDRGRGFDPPDVTNHDPARPDGWGLYIVDRLADRWGVAREGETRVWFEIDARQAGHKAVRVTHERSGRGAAIA
jgi:anti-sigma regulatory factor (Ser/Thr protein kinase)